MYVKHVHVLGLLSMLCVFSIRIPCSRHAFNSGACQFFHLKCEAAPAVARPGPATLCTRGAAQDPRRSWCPPPLHCLVSSAAFAPSLTSASVVSIMRFNHLLASVSLSSLLVLSLRNPFCSSPPSSPLPITYVHVPSPRLPHSYIVPHVLDHTSSVVFNRLQHVCQ